MQEQKMKAGITGQMERKVQEECTAEAMKSGELPVFATPALAALIEETCWRSVSSSLEDGETTVGSLLELKHLAPTPLGANVRCESRLDLIDRRRLVFSFQVFDPAGQIAEGKHERFLVDKAKFLEKAEQRKP